MAVSPCVVKLAMVDSAVCDIYSALATVDDEMGAAILPDRELDARMKSLQQYIDDPAAVPVGVPADTLVGSVYDHSTIYASHPFIFKMLDWEIIDQYIAMFLRHTGTPDPPDNAHSVWHEIFTARNERRAPKMFRLEWNEAEDAYVNVKTDSDSAFYDFEETDRLPWSNWSCTHADDWVVTSLN